MPASMLGFLVWFSHSYIFYNFWVARSQSWFKFWVSTLMCHCQKWPKNISDILHYLNLHNRLHVCWKIKMLFSLIFLNTFLSIFRNAAVSKYRILFIVSIEHCWFFNLVLSHYTILCLKYWHSCQVVFKWYPTYVINTFPWQFNQVLLNIMCIHLTWTSLQFLEHASITSMYHSRSDTCTEILYGLLDIIVVHVSEFHFNPMKNEFICANILWLEALVFIVRKRKDQSPVFFMGLKTNPVN